MREEKNPSLYYVTSLLKHPERLLIMILVGNEAVNIAISVVMASVLILSFGENGQWMAIVVTTPLLLVFGEAVPKTLAVTYPIPFSSFVSPLLMIFSKVVHPVVWVLERISGILVALFPSPGQRGTHSYTEDEFKAMVDTFMQEGGLEEAQRHLIYRVFDLADKPVSEVMVPRVDMFCLPVSLSVSEMEREILKARHTRIPVYGNDRDDILGILFIGDFFSALYREGKSLRVEKLLKKPYFVPEVKSAGSLLQEFRRRRIQIAIVVDEYSGVSGMVTIEDILEDLFEDIYNEYGVSESLWQRVDEDTLIVSGRMSIDSLNRIIEDIHIPEEDYDTVGGFVFHLFGKIPSKGEEVAFGDYLFRVEKMGKARVLAVRITKRRTYNGG